MPSLPVIRFVASSAKPTLGSLYVQCRVKPGASKQREGIAFISDTIIAVCVSARAKEGEANEAVREVFSDIGFLDFSPSIGADGGLIRY
jgi:uncharacterized protein